MKCVSYAGSQPFYLVILVSGIPLVNDFVPVLKLKTGTCQKRFVAINLAEFDAVDRIDNNRCSISIVNCRVIVTCRIAIDSRSVIGCLAAILCHIVIDCHAITKVSAIFVRRSIPRICRCFPDRIGNLLCALRCVSISRELAKISGPRCLFTLVIRMTIQCDRSACGFSIPEKRENNTGIFRCIRANTIPVIPLFRDRNMDRLLPIRYFYRPFLYVNNSARIILSFLRLAAAGRVCIPEFIRRRIETSDSLSFCKRVSFVIQFFNSEACPERQSCDFQIAPGAHSDGRDTISERNGTVIKCSGKRIAGCVFHRYFESKFQSIVCNFLPIFIQYMLFNL